MMTSDIKRHIDAARQVLVGVVPNPTSQIDQITNALIYKFMSDLDEKAINKLKGKATYFTGELERYSWKHLIDTRIGNQDRMDLYSDALEKISKAGHMPEFFREIFRDAFLPYRSPETLWLFLREINHFDYSHSEELGNAYEYLLKIMASQGDAGQFRTPRNIIDFIVDVVNPTKDDKILDPACGTAGFLVSSYRHILEQYEGWDNLNSEEKRLKPDERRKLATNFEGYDIDPGMARIARVNMYLHGFKNPKIHQYDALSSDERWRDKFSVILANPPFMSPRGGIKPHNKFSIESSRSEVLFVDYIMSHLRPNGRAGIIVPEGIIFQSSTAYKELRKKLVEDGLYAVVSLPGGVFQPYSGVKTSILLFNNEVAKQRDEILFVKVENDGFHLGATRQPINKNDLPVALDILNKWRTGEKSNSKLALYVEKTKIAEDGEYNLTGDRYRETVDYSNVKWPMVELGDLEKQGKIKFLRGQGISKKDLIKDGENKCIHYGEIYTLYRPIIKNVISRTDFEGKVLSKKGDVLIPSTTTADAMGIAVARSLNEDGVILGGDINIIRTENTYVLSDYLALLISTPPLKNQLATYAKGANILHISNSDIKKLKIPLPPFEVQGQIAAEIEEELEAIDEFKTLIGAMESTIDEKVADIWGRTISDKAHKFEISVNILNHLGRNLYRNSIAAINEAISNSWDADAKNVWIEIDEENNNLVIKDDGVGMTPEDFEWKFLRIGYSKRAIPKSKESKMCSPGGRPFIGAKGIGKLALLAGADAVSVLSKTTDTGYVGGVMDNSELDATIKGDRVSNQYTLGEVDHKLFVPYTQDHTHGTIIHFKNIGKSIRSTIPYLRRMTALYFRFALIDDNFKIHLNGKQVTLNDLNKLSEATEFLWIINDFEDPYIGTLSRLKGNPIEIRSEIDIKGFIATVAKPKDLKVVGTEERMGVDLFVNGVLREKDLLKRIPTARICESYMYGQIHFNALDEDGEDRFTTGRESVIESDEQYQSLIKNLQQSVTPQIFKQWDQLRRFRERQNFKRKTIYFRRS